MSDLMESGDSGSRSLTLIQSLQRGLRLVEVVVERGPMTARGLSDAIGIGLPTTYHLLRTLVHEGFLLRVSGGFYALGPALHSAAERERDASVVRVLRECMSHLRDATSATVVLAELDNGRAVLTHLANSRKGPRPELWIGMDLPLHATAVGKAVLNQLNATVQDAVLGRQPLEPYTFRTAMDPDRLRRELDSSAIARADDEYLLGVSCQAVSIVATERPAAIGLAFPSTFGAKRRRELEQALVAAAGGHAEESNGPEAA